MRTTTTTDIINAINNVMEKDRIKGGGVQYFLKMYEGTDFLPSPDEIKRVMLFGEGYYYE